MIADTNTKFSGTKRGGFSQWLMSMAMSVRADEKSRGLPALGLESRKGLARTWRPACGALVLALITLRYRAVAAPPAE